MATHFVSVTRMVKGVEVEGTTTGSNMFFVVMESKVRTVQDFGLLLVKKHLIPAPFQLFMDDCLLIPDCPIEVLAESDEPVLVKPCGPPADFSIFSNESDFTTNEAVNNETSQDTNIITSSAGKIRKIRKILETQDLTLQDVKQRDSDLKVSSAENHERLPFEDAARKAGHRKTLGTKSLILEDVKQRDLELTFPSGESATSMKISSAEKMHTTTETFEKNAVPTSDPSRLKSDNSTCPVPSKKPKLTFPFPHGTSRIITPGSVRPGTPALPGFYKDHIYISPFRDDGQQENIQAPK